MYRGQRIDKKQTKIVEQSCDPIFDQSFEFNLLNILQMSQPMDNCCYDVSTDNSTDGTINKIQINNKIASRIQLILLIMDWDQVEKSDVLGKIELNTQHHQERLMNHQFQNNNDQFLGQKTRQQAETDLNERKQFQQQNWYDIFYRPNMPILCTFQIKHY